MSDDAINSPLVLQASEAALSAEKPADAYVTVSAWAILRLLGVAGEVWRERREVSGE